MIVGQDEVIQQIIYAMLSNGHALLVGVPGLGKTLVVKSIAQVFSLSFKRIQFTPDLMPADIYGTEIMEEDPATGKRHFRFAQGPIFSNLILADEINRTPPKTQAALLEAMEERQVTVDGETRELPSPFFVIATQNPVEQEGTFALPEAQVDRFVIKTSLGYPDFDGELTLMKRRADRTTRSPTVESVLSTDEVQSLQETVETVRVDEDIMRYALELTRATRSDYRVQIGVSPRGSQRLFEAIRARAIVDGREYATPDTVKKIAEPVLAHRLVLTPDAQVKGVEKAAIVREILAETPVPTVEQGESR